MHIAEHTPARMVIVEKPWFLTALLVAFMLAVGYALWTEWARLDWPVRLLLFGFLVGLPVILRTYVHFVRAEFDRESARISVRRTGIAYHRQAVWPLNLFTHARVDEQVSEGRTERVVLVFDEAVLDIIDPVERARLIAAHRRGFRQAAPHEAPLTAYYSGVANAATIVATINEWAGVGR